MVRNTKEAEPSPTGRASQLRRCAYRAADCALRRGVRERGKMVTAGRRRTPTQPAMHPTGFTSARGGRVAKNANGYPPVAMPSSWFRSGRSGMEERLCKSGAWLRAFRSNSRVACIPPLSAGAVWYSNDTVQLDVCVLAFKGDSAPRKCVWMVAIRTAETASLAAPAPEETKGS